MNRTFSTSFDKEGHVLEEHRQGSYLRFRTPTVSSRSHDPLFFGRGPEIRRRLPYPTLEISKWFSSQLSTVRAMVRGRTRTLTCVVIRSGYLGVFPRLKKSHTTTSNSDRQLTLTILVALKIEDSIPFLYTLTLSTRPVGGDSSKESRHFP